MKGFRLEPDTNLADVVKRFADAAYEHQPGYFGSVEFELVMEEPVQHSSRLDECTADADNTQPYMIH